MKETGVQLTNPAPQAHTKDLWYEYEYIYKRKRGMKKLAFNWPTAQDIRYVGSKKRLML
jgi:hypothetical protein